MRPMLAAAGFALLAFAPATGPAVGQDAGLRLGLPVACNVGTDCFTQNYFDHDPGPGAKDHRCGSMTYDGHDGVDIRLRDTALQRRGVAVIASADGTVRGVRDGEPDRPVVDAAGREAVRGKECGNGVAVVHPGGWETQYCHMARGSIVVKSGQAVAAGQKLGTVGLSGWTQFPHAHLAVRQGRTEVDPFGAGAKACGGGGRVLWTPAAAAALAYRSPQVINAGFSSGEVVMEAVEQATVPRPTRTSPVLTAYARTIGLQAGDVLEVAFKSPDGKDLARTRRPPLDRAKAQWLTFIGARLKGPAWAPGRYRLEYRVLRAGKPVLTRTETLTL